MRIEEEIASSTPPLQVRELRGGVSRIEELAPEWRELCAEGAADQPFFWPEWVAAHVRAFEGGGRLALFTVRASSGRLRAVLPLVDERVLFCGIPVRRLRGAAGVHSCRFDVILGEGDGEAALSALLAHLQRRGGWDVLELRDVAEGAAAERLVALAAAQGHPTGSREVMRTPYVPLPPAGFEALLASRDAKFRANLRRRLRKLEARGEVTFTRVTDADPETLRAFYELEQAGWKGRSGTAIAASPATRGFYDQLARDAAARGALSLYVLSCGGQPIALHYGLTWRGRYLLPKPAYDERFSDCSPGQLLVLKVLEDACARGLTEFDFLGPFMDWKADWTEQVRPHSFQYVFRKGPRGALLEAAKFRVVPRLRAMVEREGAAMEAVATQAHVRGPAPVKERGLLATAVPSLRPGMVLPRARRAGLPFPFSDPGVQYSYFARNAIFTLASTSLGLSGKEVLFPAYFHGVELEALLEAGVRPRFFPVHARMRIDPADVESRIGPDTRAVYLIHYLGFPGPVVELRQLCDERGLLLIEDCALSLLSSHEGVPLGSLGDAAVFCFYKTLPAPNGGALVQRRSGPLGLPPGTPPPLTSTLAHAASSMLQGLEVRGGKSGRLLRGSLRRVGNAAARLGGASRVPTGTQHFDRSHVGLGMSSLSRTVIEAQDFRRIVELRRRNYFHLLGSLRDLHAPVFPELPPGACPLFFPFPTRDKVALHRRLLSRGVEAVDFWRGGHPSVPPGAFPEVDELRQTILELPCHQDLSPGVVERIATLVREALKEGK